MEGINTRVRKLNEDVIALFNKYDDIPIETKRFVCKDVLCLIEKASNKVIADELSNKEKEVNDNTEQD